MENKHIAPATWPMSMLSIAWAYLVLAGLMEPCWVVGLKRSEGLSKVKWTAFTVLSILASMYLLAIAIGMGLPMGASYAVWTGIGAVGSLVAGMVLFKERAELLRVFFIMLIVIGIAGVQITAGA